MYNRIRWKRITGLIFIIRLNGKQLIAGNCKSGTNEKADHREHSIDLRNGLSQSFGFVALLNLNAKCRLEKLHEMCIETLAGADEGLNTSGYK